MGDWQPSAVGSKAFSCSRKIESVLVMIPRHLLHSNFSDSFPLCIAFGLCFMPSCRAGTSRAGRRVESPNKNLGGTRHAPCTQSLGKQGQVFTPWPTSTPGAGTLCDQSVLPALWSLTFPVLEGRLSVRLFISHAARAGQTAERLPCVCSPGRGGGERLPCL